MHDDLAMNRPSVVLARQPEASGCRDAASSTQSAQHGTNTIHHRWLSEEGS